MDDNHGERPQVFSNGNIPSRYDDKGYALSGRIMLTAIVTLFFVVVIMVFLHLYARWYLLRSGRRSHRRNRRRNGNRLIFHVDNNSAAANRGLDAAVLSSLPVFVFKTLPEDSDSAAPIECAVCLSEFEDGEAGRRLPKCGHSFHTDCIDMWFHSHSTCPICRSPVEPGADPEIRVEIGEPEPGPEEPNSTGLCSECEGDASSSSSSAMEARRKKKPVSVSIEVPRRSASFGRGGDDNSPAVHTPSFRSPMSRMLSFKSRMLSSFRSPTAAATTSASCSSVNELDLEQGKDGTQ